MMITVMFIIRLLPLLFILFIFLLHLHLILIIIFIIISYDHAAEEALS